MSAHISIYLCLYFPIFRVKYKEKKCDSFLVEHFGFSGRSSVWGTKASFYKSILQILTVQACVTGCCYCCDNCGSSWALLGALAGTLDTHTTVIPSPLTATKKQIHVTDVSHKSFLGVVTNVLNSDHLDSMRSSLRSMSLVLFCYLSTHLALVSLNASEALAQRQIVSDRVPPATRCRPVVGEIVHNPFVDVLHWKPLLWWIFYCHENQTAKGVRRLGQSSGKKLGSHGGLLLRQRCHFGEGLQWQQIPSLMQPVETGEVILVS